VLSRQDYKYTGRGSQTEMTGLCSATARQYGTVHLPRLQSCRKPPYRSFGVRNPPHVILAAYARRRYSRHWRSSRRRRSPEALAESRVEVSDHESQHFSDPLAKHTTEGVGADRRGASDVYCQGDSEINTTPTQTIVVSKW
jgi:hypothetical protein